MLLLPLTILPLFVFLSLLPYIKRLIIWTKKRSNKTYKCEAIYKISQIVSFINNNLNVYFTKNLTLNIVDMFYYLYLNMSAHF